ncbi:unnamed protein product [Phaedon cochleariae]|uniref:SAYSvFN domain-containing protein n=1 Tax=Phaedon cochleariae TaxID=80249 RepID=A0A9N9SBP7_PHACE|nr:unnamed protein product [Phaedon cochleariae]
MSNIERKLAEYRAKKRTKSTPASGFWKSLFTKSDNKIADQDAKENLLGESSTNEKFVDTVDSTFDDGEIDTLSLNSDIDDSSIDCCTYTDIIYYSLCFLLWAIVWAIFIKLQFGTVYFIVSGLVGIYLNTRTRPKERGEVSAYSVFNKDCKSIDGTLKAEQFEREIRYGAGSMH